MDNVSGQPPIDPTKGPKEIGTSASASRDSFAREFLGPGATKQQIQRFLNTWVKMMVTDIKKDEAKEKKAAHKMKEIIEGKDK